MLKTFGIYQQLKVLLGHKTGQKASSHHLLEEVKKNHVIFIHNSIKQKNGGTTNSSSSDGGYPDDIEGEANSYFHLMFFRQLNIDVMVQMLARYMEYPEKREQSIYECIIGNLFEEYKFIPNILKGSLKLLQFSLQSFSLIVILYGK